MISMDNFLQDEVSKEATVEEEVLGAKNYLGS